MLMRCSQSLQQHLAEFDSVLTGFTAVEEEAFIKKIKHSSRIPSQLAIEIYRNNTRCVRVNALKVVYPACRNILGKDVFRSITKAFVDADLSGLQDLNNYGATFGQHLGSLVDAGRLPGEFDYLPVLARLEFQVHAAYYVNDDPDFDFRSFEDFMKSGSQLHFRLSESLALMNFQTPIHEIWMNNRNAEVSGASSVQAITETQYLLIHRDEGVPVVTKINACEYKLLDAFNNNRSLQDVISSLDCNVENALPNLIAKKWICGVT